MGHKKVKKPKSKRPSKKIIDPKKLKFFGITKDPGSNGDEIEKIDGDEIIGGKDTSPTTIVCQQWPTNV